MTTGERIAKQDPASRLIVHAAVTDPLIIHRQPTHLHHEPTIGELPHNRFIGVPEFRHRHERRTILDVLLWRWRVEPRERIPDLLRHLGVRRPLFDALSDELWRRCPVTTAMNCAQDLPSISGLSFDHWRGNVDRRSRRQRVIVLLNRCRSKELVKVSGQQFPF